jgi:hypothetical protein
VTRVLDFTPWAWGAGAGVCARAGVMSPIKVRLVMTAAKALRFMDVPPGVDCSFTAII